MAARTSEQPLYVVYLARVINIPAVQCHREAVTDGRTAQFFSEGCRPDTLEFQWFLDEPDLSFWEPASAISPILLQAWNAAFVAFLGFIDKFASGELIANGVYQATGVRHDLNRAEWTRERLILDVLLGDPPLFPRHEEVELSWRILDPIEAWWGKHGKPEQYAAGGWGPASAHEMMARDGRTWRIP